MSKELAASVSKSFNRLLSVDEQAVVDAISSPKVKTLDEQQFRELIAQAAVINAIKDLPSDIEVTMLQSVMENAYRTTSIKDWQTAFMLNAIGKEWKRVEAFNLFSISFLSDVIKSYDEYKAKMWRELNKSLVVHEPESKQLDGYVSDPVEVLHADCQRWLDGKKLFVEISAPFNCQRLFKKAIYKKSDWSAEAWQRMDDLAQTRIEQKYKVERRVIMGEHAQKEFQNWKSIELSRIVYIDIINQINKSK